MKYLKRHHKVTAILLAAGFCFVAAVFGLSLIPHVHGNDFNHSSHPDCPLHQLSVSANADLVPVQIFDRVDFKSESVEQILFSFISQATPQYENLRAPPAL